MYLTISKFNEEEDHIGGNHEILTILHLFVNIYILLKEHLHIYMYVTAVISEIKYF